MVSSIILIFNLPQLYMLESQKIRKTPFYRVKQRHHYQQYQQYQLLPANYNLDNTCRTFKFN